MPMGNFQRKVVRNKLLWKIREFNSSNIKSYKVSEKIQGGFLDETSRLFKEIK